MKKIILFAVSMSAVLLGGCLPQQKLTGRVVDTTGPVPGAAVLAMVWVEDSGKALPAPDTAGLAGQELDVALEKDMAERGLPKAYARSFADDSGEFTLEKMHFSDETRKAVRAMTQPKITRVTVNAFQRGYLKHAATMFPKGISDELAPAVVKLSRPTDWKQLALDNYFRLLRRDEYDQGYSKHFGATREEKKWFLNYVSGNLADAYQASNIKGDKQWVEDCGHDFSDIMVSSAGIQYNPAREKCNLLLRQAGILRDWEELWLTHAYSPVAGQSPAVSAIKEAIDGLGPEYAEVRQYEAQIIAGAETAAKEYNKSQGNTDLRNGLNETSPIPLEAQRLYNSGDRPGAYKTLGYSLFNGLPAELKRGTLTARLPVTIVPKIKETSAGFYLLVNRPLTAQLPGGDGGNHKDKPKAEMDKSTETNKDEGARIILAEKELVVFQDGKEVRRELIPDGSRKVRQIYAEVKEANKTGKNMRVEEHALKEPRLLFYDKTGKMAKELKLGGKGQGVVRQKHALLKSERPIQQTFRAEAWVSENEKRALYVESVMECELEDDNVTQKLCLGTTSDYRYLSSDGQILFKKQLPPAYSVWRAVVSDNGKVVVVVNNCEMPDWECPGPGEEEDSLIVYDETGKKLMGHPSALTDLDISPNGKYLAAYGTSNIYFFNTQNPKVWSYPRGWAVEKIGDDGKAYLNAYDRKAKQWTDKRIDLTEYLGE